MQLKPVIILILFNMFISEACNQKTSNDVEVKDSFVTKTNYQCSPDVDCEQCLQCKSGGCGITDAYTCMCACGHYYYGVYCKPCPDRCFHVDRRTCECYCL